MLKVVKANDKPMKQAKINVVFNKQAFINYKPRFYILLQAWGQWREPLLGYKTYNIVLQFYT